MFYINIFLLVAGFFLPPVAVILMAAPILMPIILGQVSTLIGFVVLTINMEIGLISPPVGLNLYVINGIAPEIPLKTILTGSLPYVACMIIAILIFVYFGIATWLPDALMGAAVVTNPTE